MNSLHDLKLGADVVDTITVNPDHVGERGLFTIDRMEISSYDAVPD